MRNSVLNTVAAIFLLLWLIPVILIRSWAITVIWRWYLTPYSGLQPPRMVFAFGFVLLLTAIMPRFSMYEDPDRSMAKKMYDTFGVPLISPLFLMMLAWIGTWFI